MIGSVEVKNHPPEVEMGPAVEYMRNMESETAGLAELDMEIELLLRVVISRGSCIYCSIV